MSMLVTTVVPEGIVMAADSSLLILKMIDMVNFFKGNTQEAIKNTMLNKCACVKENIVGNKSLSKSIRKLYVMKGNNIAIASGNQLNIGNNSITPHIEHFCNNKQFDDPKTCAENLLNFIVESA